MSDDQGHPRSGGNSGTERELAAEVDALRVDVAALVGRFEALQRRLVGDGQATLVEQIQDNLADVASGEVVGALFEEVRAVRSQLAEGRGIEPAVAREDDADLEALADQVAALRDFVASELDTLRQTVSARIDAAAEATAATVAAATTRPEPEAVPQPAEVRPAVDTDAVELLRDEIRAAGAIPDQVIEALREELKALRRRISVKASERVLDDAQLAQIADAVADRLAADRDLA